MHASKTRLHYAPCTKKCLPSTYRSVDIPSFDDKNFREFQLFITDTKGRLYDVEVVDEKDYDKFSVRLGRQEYLSMRYHLAYDKNADSSETILIVFARKDFFGNNKQKYIISETGNTGAVLTKTIIVNTEKQEDSELGNLVHDLFCENTDDMIYQCFADEIERLKQDDDGIQEAYHIWKDGRLLI